jgi:hypothetical protein
VSDVALVATVAAVTVGSRVAATALLPAPRGRLAEVIGRLPAPLFAAMAALSLVRSESGSTDPAMLVAVGCALVSTRWRSLLLTVVAGLAGYVLGDHLLGTIAR